ncbi:MAG: hypothetical protein QXP34_01880 [Candidatus Aenigmatarchaeota archaeon]
MRKKTYKLYKIDVELKEKAIRELILNDNFENASVIVYELEFKSSELNEFKNNFIVYQTGGNFYIVPLSYRIDGDLDKFIDDIKHDAKRYSTFNYIRDFIESYKDRLNKLIRYYEQLYDKEKIDSIDLNAMYGNVEIYFSADFEFNFGFRYVREKVEEFVNLYILKNKKIPSNDEVKEFLINYSQSFDLKEVIENIINKLKLVLINI